MKADAKQAADSTPPTDSDQQAGDSKGIRPRRSRGRADPMRMQGAWVISDETRQAIERCDLFRELNRQQMMAVAALVEECTLEPNEVLIGEGEPARYLYVIVEGRGTAHVQMEHGWLSLGLVGPYDSAGWSSLVDGQVYPASVKSLTHMRVARIETSGLTLLMNLEPEIGYPIHRSLSSIFYRQYDAALRAFKTA